MLIKNMLFKVELVIKNYRPVKVLVKGEVDKRGLVDLQGSMSVEV